VDDLEKYIQESLKDDEFRKEWERSEKESENNK
jgi:hypothetical protein